MSRYDYLEDLIEECVVESLDSKGFTGNLDKIPRSKWKDVIDKIYNVVIRDDKIIDRVYGITELMLRNIKF